LEQWRGSTRKKASESGGYQLEEGGGSFSKAQIIGEQLQGGTPLRKNVKGMLVWGGRWRLGVGEPVKKRKKKGIETKTEKGHWSFWEEGEHS